MTAIVLKDISPIVTKGSLLDKKGKYYVLRGEKKETRPTSKTITDSDTGKEVTEYYQTPNFYHKDVIDGQKGYFKKLR